MQRKQQESDNSLLKTEKKVTYETSVKEAIDRNLKKNYFKGTDREKALVMYSGGMDSVSLLWNLLEHTEQEIFVHAISIQNSEGRFRAEAKAVQDSINFMKGVQRPFSFSSSTYSLMTEHPGGRDMVLALFQAMRVSAGLNENFNIVYTGDYNVGRDEGCQAQSMINTLSSRYRKPTWLTPFEEMTKSSNERSKGIYLSMPENLRHMYWSCRRPKQIVDRFIVCGECHACERQQFMKESLDNA